MVYIFFLMTAINVDEFTLDAVCTEKEGGSGRGLREGDDAFLVIRIANVGQKLVINARIAVFELEASVAIWILVVLPEF